MDVGEGGGGRGQKNNDEVGPSATPNQISTILMHIRSLAKIH